MGMKFIQINIKRLLLIGLVGILLLTLLPLSIAHATEGIDTSIGEVNYHQYQDDSSVWHDIDNSWQLATAPWDWQMLEDSYHTYVLDDFTAKSRTM